MPLPDSTPRSAIEELLFQKSGLRDGCAARRRTPQRRRLDFCFWRSNQFHESEEGMLTLATVITVLGLVVLIAFLGNIGEAVVEKIEMQNDADAAAYSSALWMARGMNAVTTTNHLLGEITALCVLHEALGGPELDAAAPTGDWPVDSDVADLNDQNRFLKDPAPVTEYSPYWKAWLETPHKLDKELVDFTLDQMAKKNERFKAAAMIYDAKVTLKRQLLAMLQLKTFANAGYFVPPWIGPFPVGIATAIAASAVHLYASGVIIKLVQEWMTIELIEKAAIAMSSIKTGTLETLLIPAIVNYADQIAKVDSGGGSVILQQRVQGALDELDGRRGTQLSTFPAPRDLKLPLMKEPRPQSGGQAPSLIDEPLANTDLDQEHLDRMQQMKSKLEEASEKDTRPATMEEVKTIATQISDLKKNVDKLEAEKKADEEKAKAAEEQAKKDNKPVPQPTPEETAAAQARDQEIQDSKAKQAELAEQREKLIKQLKVMGKGSTNGDTAKDDNREMNQDELDETDPDKDFPSDDTLKAQARFKDPDKLQAEVTKLEKLDRDMGALLQDKDAALSPTETSNLKLAQKQVQRELRERKKELGFAQQPGGSGNTNSLSNLGGKNPSSANLAKVRLNEEQEKVTQWMRASYPHMDALRAPLLGMMNSLLSKSRAAQSYKVWSERYSIIKPFMFRDGKQWRVQGGLPNLSPDNNSSQGPLHMYVLKDTYENNGVLPRKGFEPWRKGINPAEKYFTIIGFAYRPAHDGLFADVLFKSAHPDGNLALSQAMVYNANLETLPTSSQRGSVQPSVGWDTLNWETPVQAPEHGNASGEQGFLWPWELFESNSSSGTARNKVKLNWQAKLVPVTETRAKTARSNSLVPSEVRKVLERSKKNFDSLIQH